MEPEASSKKNIHGVFYLLYFIIIIFCIGGILICVAVGRTLRRYGHSHANFSIIQSHLFLCLAVNNFMVLWRCVSHVNILKKASETIAENADTCKASSPINASLSFFMFLGCIASLIERTYATINSIKYEHENYSAVIDRIFYGIWIIVSVLIFYDSISSFVLSTSPTYYKCVLFSMKENLYKTYWQLLVIEICMMAFFLFFIILYQANMEKLTKMRENHSTYQLSHAYQLRENIKSIKIMGLYTGLFVIHGFGFLYHQYYIRQVIDDDEANIFLWNELSNLYIPIYTVFLPLCIMFNARSICNKVMLHLPGRHLWRQLTEYLYGRKGTNAFSKNEEYFDELTSFWDDKLHGI